jgi:hypothetical protein
VFVFPPASGRGGGGARPVAAGPPSASTAPAAIVHAHRAILAAKSPYFRDQFFGERKTSLRLADVGVDTMMEVLQVCE